MNKVVVITGEKSGEMHAAKVCRELILLNPSVKIIGWGGEGMKAAGVDIKRNISTLAIMGFWEVLVNIFFLKRLFTECKEMILGFEPDMILYVDYSGFNLRMAKWSAKNGFVNHYFIPPKTWAWNQKRTNKLRQFFKKVYTILPFEQQFFESFGVEATYVGNPSKEAVDDLKLKAIKPKTKKTIALIPGSRASEIKRCLPLMCTLRSFYADFDFVISGVDSVDRDLYKVAQDAKIPVKFNSFFEILHQASFAVVTSGTATLETALMNVPQVVVFKTSWLTYQIARFFIKVPYISLVNLIAEDLVVDELIQDDFNEISLKIAIDSLIEHEKVILEKYKKIHDSLGEKRPASEVAKELNYELNSHT